jgi:2-hydroxychromene-2-carboxylate isomerase
MTEPIELLVDFVLPFGWFSAERIGGLVRSHVRTVAWRPLLPGETCPPARKLLCEKP